MLRLPCLRTLVVYATCLLTMSGCATPGDEAPAQPKPPSVAAQVVTAVSEAKPAGVRVRSEGDEIVVAMLGSTRGADETRVYPSCEAASCSDGGMSGARASTIVGYDPSSVRDAFRAAGVGMSQQTGTRIADYVPRVGANAVVLSTTYPAEVDGALVWVDSSVEAARDRFLAHATLAWDNPRGTSCSDGTRTPGVVFWKGNVVVYQQVRMLLCPTVPTSNDLTQRIVTALDGLTAKTRIDVPAGGISVRPVSGDDGVVLRDPQPSPSTTTNHSGTPSPTCPDSPQAPAVVASAGTPLAKYADDPQYESTSYVPPGTTEPRDGMPTRKEFARAWCSVARAGTSYEQVFARTGLPNLRLGAYSVWEVDQTRYFITFDASGKVKLWASFQYPAG